jgi:hypothetical protein
MIDWLSLLSQENDQYLRSCTISLMNVQSSPADWTVPQLFYLGTKLSDRDWLSPEEKGIFLAFRDQYAQTP